jgi:hypothetical protein
VPRGHAEPELFILLQDVTSTNQLGHVSAQRVGRHPGAPPQRGPCKPRCLGQRPNDLDPARVRESRQDVEGAVDDFSALQELTM